MPQPNQSKQDMLMSGQPFEKANGWEELERRYSTVAQAALLWHRVNKSLVVVIESGDVKRPIPVDDPAHALDALKHAFSTAAAQYGLSEKELFPPLQEAA